MSDLNVISVTPKSKIVTAIQVTRPNVEDLRLDERFHIHDWTSTTFSVMTNNGLSYAVYGSWITLDPYGDNRVVSDRELREEYDGIPEDYDPNQRVLF